MENWQRTFALFEQAIARPVEERLEWLARACADDTSLRQSVEEMLVAHEESSILDRPLLQRPPQGLARPLARAPHASPDPQTLGPYRILRRLGQGGMGTVYLADRSDGSIRRQVAIKLVRPGTESETSLRRLRVEQQILADLDHPNIAKLYDSGSSDNGLPYFVLEYVEGVPIDTYCTQNQLSVDERLTLFRKICSAVQYAHQSLVIHRDIKPSNILIRFDGEPKLLDFGLAKWLDAELAVQGEPTATWQRLLTPNYASPEQFRGLQLTTSTDIYSLGVLLYKLLTGCLPHSLSGCSVSEIERILTETEPLPPSVAVMEPCEEDPTVPADGRRGMSHSELQKTLRGDLDAIVLKSLRSASKQRYGSVERLANDIERYQLGLTVTARAGTWRYRGGKFLRRHRSAVASAVAITILLIGFAVAMAFQASRIAFERDQVREEHDKKSQVLSLLLEIFRVSSPYGAPGEELTAREALERSVPVLENRLHQQPSVRAELLHTSGSILRILGVFDAAQRQLEEALEIRQRLYGDDHPDVALTLSSLAALRKDEGDVDEAEALARRSVDIARRLAEDGPDWKSGPLLSKPLNVLVSILCFRHEYTAAEEPALEALALARELPTTSARITALEHLARIRGFQTAYRESVALNREALMLRRRHYGEKHPKQIATLNNLGVSLRGMQEYAAARSAYQEALRLNRANFGTDREDPYLLNNLASVHASLEEFVQAEALFREARQVVLDRFGERHWMVLAFSLQIARMEIRQGLLAQSEQVLRDLLASWTAELGGSWLLDLGTGLLGESLSLQNRCAEARPPLVSSFEALRSHTKDRIRQEAFSRLRDHLERCGEPESIASFSAML